MRAERPVDRVVELHGDLWVAEPLLELGDAPAGAYRVPADLRLSAALARDLQVWHDDAWDPVRRAIVDGGDVSRLGVLPDPGHAVEGFRLAARVQRELGDGWRVQHTSFHLADSAGGRPEHTVLLRTLDGDSAAGVVETTDGAHRLRSARSMGASPGTEADLARWRRAFLDSPDAEARAVGAEVAAALQRDFGSTATIRYCAGDDPAGVRP